VESKNVNHLEESSSEENKRARLKQKKTEAKEEMKNEEKKVGLLRKKKRDRAKRELLNMSKKALSATISYCRDIGRKELQGG